MNTCGWSLKGTWSNQYGNYRCGSSCSEFLSWNENRPFLCGLCTHMTMQRLIKKKKNLKKRILYSIIHYIKLLCPKSYTTLHYRSKVCIFLDALSSNYLVTSWKPCRQLETCIHGNLCTLQLNQLLILSLNLFKRYILPSNYWHYRVVAVMSVMII